MPRTARAIVGGVCYHVINRGNARATVFHDATDFQTFLGLMDGASERVGLDLLAYCLMPNHYHFVLRPRADDDIARWVHWLSVTYAHRHRGRHGSVGHVWQGRFKPFPIQADGHLVAVLRYVERNALRAGLVGRAEDWAWGSLRLRTGDTAPSRLCDPPVPLPADWVERVNAEDSPAELETLRHSIARGTPFGEEGWVRSTAQALGLEHTLRSRGRPRKAGTSG